MVSPLENIPVDMCQGIAIPSAALGTLETFTGVPLLIPRFRRWGACPGTFLLSAFMVFIAIHYNELRGVDCFCFPWVKRTVGPAFFAGDGAMMFLAIAAGVWVRASQGIRPAAVILGTVAGRSFPVTRGRQSLRILLQSAVPPLP